VVTKSCENVFINKVTMFYTKVLPLGINMPSLAILLSFETSQILFIIPFIMCCEFCWISKTALSLFLWVSISYLETRINYWVQCLESLETGDDGHFVFSYEQLYRTDRVVWACTPSWWTNQSIFLKTVYWRHHGKPVQYCWLSVSPMRDESVMHNPITVK
jgi:hypothetical protein